MIMYLTDVNVFIDEKDTDKLIEFCKRNDFEFEDDSFPDLHRDPEWQEHYRKLTGFYGSIKSCWITQRTLSNPHWDDIVSAFNKADFDVMIRNEIS